MAAKPFPTIPVGRPASLASRIILIFIAFTITGILTMTFVKSRRSIARGNDIERFISTYISLAIARHEYLLQPDSLQFVYDDIYRRHRTDSAWVRDFARRLSVDPLASRQVWDEIVERLDSLEKADTLAAPGDPKDKGIRIESSEIHPSEAPQSDSAKNAPSK
jgi:hypothetical protein